MTTTKTTTAFLSRALAVMALIASMVMIVAITVSDAKSEPRYEDNSQPAVVYVHDSPGGIVNKFKDNVAKWNDDGTRVIISGSCVSACTIYTNLDNVCFMPGTTLYFHAPSITDLDQTRYWDMSNRAIHWYPRNIQRFLRAMGGLDNHYIVLWPDWAHYLIPVCGVNTTDDATEPAEPGSSVTLPAPMS